MEKFVITIGREYGSGGRGIAHRLADALGIRYYDKELIRMASEDSGISEALFNLTDEKLEDKFLRKHGISKGTLVSQPQPDRLTKEELFQFQSEIIRRVADLEESCIIIGRCGQYILRDRSDLVRIFIHADQEYCIEKLMNRYGISRGGSAPPRKDRREQSRLPQTLYRNRMAGCTQLRPVARHLQAESGRMYPHRFRLYQKQIRTKARNEIQISMR